MNISFTEKRDNFARIELNIELNDYQEGIEKKLKMMRRNASIPGFRKGNVPAGMIRKMYYGAAKAEEVQNLISEQLFNFINDNKLETIGQPVSTPGVAPADIDKDDNFFFSFDQALIPPFGELLSKADSFEYITAEAAETDVDTQLQNALAGAGERIEADNVEEGDFIKGSMVELDGDLPKEGGIRLENKAFMLPRYIKNEEEKAKFIGAPRNSVVIFDPFRAYDGAEAEISSLLGITKEQVAEIEGKQFSFEIVSISRHQNAELNQAFYDKVFGEGTVTDEAGARTRIRESIEGRTVGDSNMKFINDVKEYLREHKLDAINLADDTIKLWWTTLDDVKKMSQEEIDTQFPEVLSYLKVDLCINALAKKYEVTVVREEIEEMARQISLMQLQQYGIDPFTMGTQLLDTFTQRLLNDKSMVSRIEDNIRDMKIADKLRDDVTINERKVPYAEFANAINDVPAEDKSTEDASAE